MERSPVIPKTVPKITNTIMVQSIPKPSSTKAIAQNIPKTDNIKATTNSDLNAIIKQTKEAMALLLTQTTTQGPKAIRDKVIKILNNVVSDMETYTTSTTIETNSTQTGLTPSSESYNKWTRPSINACNNSKEQYWNQRKHGHKLREPQNRMSPKQTLQHMLNNNKWRKSEENELNTRPP